MTTRFNTGAKSNYGQQPLQSGYEKKSGIPELTIPSCGIEDVDIAMFKLFDKEISPQCGGIDSTPVKKVPIIFAAGEKWAILKKGRPLRDRNNTLIIPLITIMRTEVSQDMSADVAGRGINQQTGEIVIRRKLNKSDRSYQALINRILLPNQQNVAVAAGSEVFAEQLSTSGPVGELSNTAAVKDGALLSPNVTNNSYETIVVPSPQFYTVKYQVTVWTQYTQHTNQILERLVTSYLPQAQSWRLDTEKGYWFVGRVDGGAYTPETNFEDMAQKERFIKYSFNVIVPAYFFASDAPGSPIPVKRYVSSPIINFEISPEMDEGQSSEYVLGSDDPTLPLDIQQNNRLDQRTPGWRQQKVYPIFEDPNDPALLSMPRGQEVVRVVNTSAKGETVFSGQDLGQLQIVLTK